MSIWGFGEKRRAVLAVSALLGLAATARAETDRDRRLRQLEQQLKATMEQMQQLQKEVAQQKAITRASEEQLQHANDTADLAKAKTSKLPDWLGYFTPFGDVRIRTEGFYNQPHLRDQVVTANTRERVRARFGIRANYGDEVGATVRIATGNINDPISTNQTETGNFTPFSVNLDWAYPTVAPGKTFNMRPGWLTVNAGKFPNAMFRVGKLVFDEDLAPEGFSETFSLLENPIGNPSRASLEFLKLT